MSKFTKGKIVSLLMAFLIFAAGICASAFFSNNSKTEKSVVMTMSQSDSRYVYGFGKLPDPAYERIMKTLNSCTPIDINNPEVFNRNAKTLTLQFNGDPDLLLTIDSNGYAEFIDGEKAEYYKIGCYYKIVEIAAKYLPFCDWEAMSHSKKIADVFEEFADDITIGTSPVDGFDSWLRLYGNDVYTVFVDQYGKITIFYENEYGTPTVTYMAPPEFYDKIKSILAPDEIDDRFSAVTELA